MNKILYYTTLFFLINFISCNKEEITELEKRNEELIVQTARLQKQISELTDELNNISVDVTNLTSNNNDLSSKIVSLQNTINELEEALNDMTDDYEQSQIENNQLYDEYLSIINNKNELQAQLDSLISEINEINCPPIEFSSSDMKNEQLFCTNGFIQPIEYAFDESKYSFSFIQDSIPEGINIIKSEGLVKIVGGPASRIINLYSFDLKFTNDQCEIVKRVVLARSPESPIIELISGPLVQSFNKGTQMEAIKFFRRA